MESFQLLLNTIRNWRCLSWCEKKKAESEDGWCTVDRYSSLLSLLLEQDMMLRYSKGMLNHIILKIIPSKISVYNSVNNKKAKSILPKLWLRKFSRYFYRYNFVGFFHETFQLGNMLTNNFPNASTTFNFY